MLTAATVTPHDPDFRIAVIKVVCTCGYMRRSSSTRTEIRIALPEDEEESIVKSQVQRDEGKAGSPIWPVAEVYAWTRSCDIRSIVYALTLKLFKRRNPAPLTIAMHLCYGTLMAAASLLAKLAIAQNSRVVSIPSE